MAYVPNNLGIIVHAIGGTGIRLISYRTDDPKEDLLTVGYFEDAREKGLRRSDMVFVTAINGVEEPYALVIETIEADGSGTAVLSAADTALQLSDVADVAISGDYNDLLNLPTLGTAAAQDISYFALAAQAVPAGGTTGQVLTRGSNTPGDWTWTTNRDGDMLASVYDPQTIAEDAFDATTRSVLVARIGGGWVPKNGRVYRAAGFAYVGSTGATAIPDLPGLLPFGDIEVEHFGAKGDLELDLGASGFVRTGGTNDYSAFLLANAYATTAGVGKFFADGNYFVDSTAEDVRGAIELTSRLASRKDFSRYLWLRYNVYQQGIRLLDSRVRCDKFKVIGQYDRQGIPKPAGGHRGAIVGTQWYVDNVTQSKVEGVGADLLLCRAANVPGQSSSSSIAVFVTGWTENHHFRLGTHGKTNVVCNCLYIEHFGGKTVEPDMSDAYTFLETYHPLGGKCEFSTEIDNADTPMNRVWESASAGDNYFGSATSRGLGGPFTIGVGDMADAYTVVEQRGRVNKGIRFGRQIALDCKGQPDWSNHAIYIKGRGGSKFEFYDGTAIPLERQSPYDIKGDGIYMTCDPLSPTFSGKAIFAWHILGKVDLGECWIYGSPIAIEREAGHADFRYNLVESDGTIKHEFAQGGRILGSGVRKGDARGDTGAASGADVPGWEANNRCISVIGRSHTATTSANISRGDTTIPITGLTEDVFIDDDISIGGHWVRARAAIQDGVPYLITSPMPADVASGAAVVIDQRATLDELVGSFESSEEGLVLSEAHIYDADLSDVKFTGATAVRLNANSTLRIVKGGLPRAVGMVEPTTANYTIDVQDGCRLFLDDMRILTADRVSKHINLNSTGRAVIRSSLIQGIASLAAASTNLVTQMSLDGCFDFSGIPLTNATGVWTPTLKINNSTAGVVLTVASATYTVSEDLVWLNWDFTLSSKGANTGPATIGGLPFPPTAAGVGTGTAAIPSSGALSASNALIARALASNGGEITLQQQSTTSYSTLTDARITDTTRVVGSVSYKRALS